MFDLVLLELIIEEYKKDFNTIHKQEIYKWKAVKWFQDNWLIDAEDFAAMIEHALVSRMTGNLLDSRNRLPRRMICLMAQKDPVAVRSMFINLYNEDIPLIERIENFIARAEELRQMYDEGSWVNHFQSTNSVSVYLFLYRPDKYFMFKYQKYRDFAKKINASDVPKKGRISDVQNYFDLCSSILGVVKEDADLLKLSKSRLSDDDYADDNFHILVDDIIYYGSWKDNEPNWKLPINITQNQWYEILGNSEVITNNETAMLRKWLHFDGVATCSEVGALYNEHPSTYNAQAVSFAKRVQTYTNCNFIVRDDTPAWWNIPFTGEYINNKSHFQWTIRPELLSAMQSRGFISYEPPPETKTENDVNYWWLNASPKIWSFSEIKIGEIINYSLFNDNNNKRRIFQHFLDAKTGDLVIGYESTPVKKIVALLRIAQENDGNYLYFEKLEGLTIPVALSAFKDAPELSQMEYLLSPQGSLFKLTIAEHEYLLDMIREENPVSISDSRTFERYNKDDFLVDVFISGADYDSLKSLLERKLNVILQGAPGVGKTFAAKRLAYSILGKKDDSRIKVVQFHQSYSYEDFVIGYRPGDSGYELIDGIFYNFCKQAENHPGEKYFLIIDEINRGNLSKVFGELLMMIEKGYRGEKISMAYDGRTFSVPENLYIIGLMNTADRSLALIDYALRRRFSFFEMKPAFSSDGFRTYQRSLKSQILDELIDVVKQLNQAIRSDPSLGDGFQIGHSYFCEQTVCTDEWLEEIVKYDLIPIIKEYWFDNEKKFTEWSEKLDGVVSDD